MNDFDLDTLFDTDPEANNTTPTTMRCQHVTKMRPTMRAVAPIASPTVRAQTQKR
jgi:hypothetical protein